MQLVHFAGVAIGSHEAQFEVEVQDLQGESRFLAEIQVRQLLAVPEQVVQGVMH